MQAAAIKSLRIPTVFDGPCHRLLPMQGPKVRARRIGLLRSAKYLLGNIYCVGAPRFPWSTLTPGPIVLETDTFFK